MAGTRDWIVGWGAVEKAESSVRMRFVGVREVVVDEEALDFLDRLDILVWRLFALLVCLVGVMMFCGGFGVGWNGVDWKKSEGWYGCCVTCVTYVEL